MPYRNMNKRKAYASQWYYDNKGRIGLARKNKRDNDKNYRTSRLSTMHGTVYGLHKRPYPNDNKCEICNRVMVIDKPHGRHLNYHHWDHDNLNKGMWICNRCHRVAEGIERGYHTIYIELKNRIEIEMKDYRPPLKQPRNTKKDAIIKLIQEGKHSNVEIANMLCSDKSYVSMIRRDYGYERHYNLSKDKVEYLIKNYGKMPCSEISKVIGYPTKKIYNQAQKLRKRGIDIRYFKKTMRD